MYSIMTTISRKGADGYHVVKSLPTFYLDRNVQGITSAAHAEEVAQDILSCWHSPETLVTVSAFLV